VPEIKETYDNVKLLFDLTKLNNIPYKFVADFKLLLILNGQQTATSTYPCPYCFISLQDLRSSQDAKINNTQGGNILKNYGHLQEDYKKFCTTGKNKKFAKDCHSTINAPVFEENISTTVIEKCVIPELHLLQGLVNHLFWNGLVPLLGKKKALLWPQKLKLIAKGYHGNCLPNNVKTSRCTPGLGDYARCWGSQISSFCILFQGDG
jgi:hypothetical protein